MLLTVPRAKDNDPCNLLGGFVGGGIFSLKKKENIAAFL